MKTIRIEYMGVDGSGPTVSAAKEDARHKIEWAMKQGKPRLIGWRGWIGLAAAHPEGWQTTVFEATEPPTNSCWSFTSSTDWEHVHQGLLCHMAQCAWRGNDDADVPPGMSAVNAREFGAWCEWQRRYARAIANGLTSDQAHSAAGRNPATPELWHFADAA